MPDEILPTRLPVQASIYSPMSPFPDLPWTPVFEPAPEGGYTSTFAEIPDVFSEGGTIAEAEANLFDALELLQAWHWENS